MTKYGNASIGGVLVDGVQLITYLTSVGPMKKSAVAEDATVLGNAWRHSHDSTLREFSIGPFEGFYDDTAFVATDAVFGVAGVYDARVVCVLHDGNTAGLNFVGCEPKQISYERSIVAGELHKVAVEFEGSGEMDDGIILHAVGSETADGNTEGALSQDAGALSILGAAAYLQMQDLTLDGGTNLAVHIRHSDDDITYATLGSFTPRTAAGAERISVAVGVTINRYIASSWVWTGSEGASASSSFMVGFARYLVDNS